MKRIDPSENDRLDQMLRRAVSEGLGEADTAWFDSMDISGVTFDRSYRQKRAQIICGERPSWGMTRMYRRRMRIAIWVAMISVLLAATALTASAVKESWREWVSWEDDRFALSIVDPDETIGTYSVADSCEESPALPTSLIEFRKPRYLPNGVSEEICRQDAEAHSLMYYRDGVFVCEFRQLVWDGELPSRRAENVALMPVDVNGNAAVLTDRGDGRLSLVWHDGEYVYELNSAGGISRDDLLRIAQSVVTPDPANLLHRYHLQSFRKPASIPDGMSESVVSQNEDSHMIHYLVNGTTMITFEQTLLDATEVYESAGVSLAEVEINGNKGVQMIYENGRGYVVWSDGEYQYRLYAENETCREILLAMARSVPLPQ